MLARFAANSKASIIERMPQERRLATLMAVAHNLEETAQDDAVDVLELLIANLLRKSAEDYLAILSRRDIPLEQT